MKKNFSFIITMLFFMSSTVTFSQTALKMGATGGPAGNGPLTTPQPVTLIDAGTGVAYVPAVIVTYSLSNQQFGAGTVEGLAANSAMNFGATLTTTNSTMSASALYPLMNSIGGATNAMLTACNSCAAGTGIAVTTDRSIGIFNCTDALISSGTVNLQPLNARVYYGDLTISFNRPVSNPVLQFVGMGGATNFSSAGIIYDMGFATEFDLVGTGVTLSKLSGNAQLSVSATQINNNSTWLGASSVGTASNGITRFGASGSVAAVGTNITSITLKMYVRGDGGRINNGTTVVAAGTANGNTIYPVWSIGATNPWLFVSPFVGNVSGDLMLFGVSLQKPVTISGTVFNDPDGGNVNNSSGGANLVPAGLFANLLDANGKVVAVATVGTNGTYSFPAIFEGANLSVSISTTSGTQGALAPAVTLPADWAITGEFNGTPNTGSDATANGTSALFTVGAVNVINTNFGIERLPESAFNLQISQTNPGGLTDVVVPAAAFQLNNVGATPNTQDYDIGTVTNIRITAFPANVTSITINGIQYTSGTWLGGGVTVPYTNGTGPSQAISVDPIDGAVNVVIPFAAIDNLGKEDATPGSVTVPFSTVLPVRGIIVNGNLNGGIITINWNTVGELGVIKFELQRSLDGVNFIAMSNQISKGDGDKNYNAADNLVDITGKTAYYRIKTIDNNGNYYFSGVIKINLNELKGVMIRPNPFTAVVNLQFNVQVKTKATVRIYNVEGKQVYSRYYELAQGLNSIEANGLDKLPAGNYILELNAGGAVMSQKIIKVK